MATEKGQNPSNELDLYTEHLPAHSTENHLCFFRCFQASRYNTGETDQTVRADSRPKQCILQPGQLARKGK